MFGTSVNWSCIVFVLNRPNWGGGLSIWRQRRRRELTSFTALNTKACLSSNQWNFHLQHLVQNLCPPLMIQIWRKADPYSYSNSSSKCAFLTHVLRQRWFHYRSIYLFTKSKRDVAVSENSKHEIRSRTRFFGTVISSWLWRFPYSGLFFYSQSRHCMTVRYFLGSSMLSLYLPWNCVQRVK